MKKFKESLINLVKYFKTEAIIRLNIKKDKEIQLFPASKYEFLYPDLSIITGNKSAMSGHFLFLFNLAREIKAQQIVEIGFGGANSALAFLLALKETGGHLYSIDIQPDPGAISRIEKANMMSRFHLIHGKSQEVWKQVPSEIDILLIDGNHSYNQCKLDYELYEPLVKSGGFILFHDSSTIKGVIKFTDKLKKKVYESLQIPYCNGLFVIRKK